MPSPVLFTDIAQLVQALPSSVHNPYPLQITHNAVLLVHNGIVVDAGPHTMAERLCAQHHPTQVSLRNRAVLPGFVDSHTHVLFAGSRIDDFDMRTQGRSYADIQKAGGGIYHTVQQVTSSEDADILKDSAQRLKHMLSYGVTTCEIKTGYGLECDQEMRLLKLIQTLQSHTPINLVPTALAHVPPLHAVHNKAAYLQQYLETVVLPGYAQGLLHRVDIYVDSSAFSCAEAKVFLTQVKKAGIPCTLHAQQWSCDGAVALAAEMGALSADHLEHCSAQDMALLATHGVVATVLPGCALFLGSKSPWPQARAMRDAGCEVAVATDCNPGSSMITHLPLCATWAATQCGLTLQEAIWGITKGGAKALGLHDRGGLQCGERADFVVLNNNDYRSVLYHATEHTVEKVYIQGQCIALR